MEIGCGPPLQSYVMMWTNMWDHHMKSLEQDFTAGSISVNRADGINVVHDHQ